MALLQALLSLISRSARTVLNAIFGWAVRALFGQPSAKEQPFLTGVVAAAAAWPVLLLGIAFPKIAALVVAFVPFHNRAPAWTIRLGWIVLAAIVPILVGLAVATKAPAGRGGRSFWRRALSGWPITIALAAAFLIMFVSVPLLKLVSIVRKRRDEQVPLITSAYDYHDVAHAIIGGLNRNGFDLRRREPSWWVSAPTKILRKLGGDAFAAYVPESLEYHHEPGEHGLEAALYPSCLLLRGAEFAAVRAHGLALEIATYTPALQTTDPQAQALEHRIHSLWEFYDREIADGAGTEAMRSAVTRLTEALNELQAPYSDWETLYRQLLQVDRAIAGERQLLSRERPLISRAVQSNPAWHNRCSDSVGVQPTEGDGQHMDALKLLKHQHRLVEKLFEQFEAAEDDGEKHALFDEIADNLAVHTAIEERFFYPAVRARQTQENLEEAYDEHLDAKKIIVDAMGHPDAPGFDAKVAALKGAIEHHVEEEEGELFPKVKELMTPEALEALAQLMEAEATRLLEAGAPRSTIQLKAEEPSVHA